ncbi:MAG: CTB family bacteriocin [Nostochopsis sp.]
MHSEINKMELSEQELDVVAGGAALQNVQTDFAKEVNFIAQSTESNDQGSRSDSVVLNEYTKTGAENNIKLDF